MVSYAYVTLLLNTAYLPGALTVCQSLKDSGSTVPIILLYSQNEVSKEAIDALRDSGFFNRMLNVDGDLIETRNRYELDHVLKRSDLDKTLTKLNCWRLIDYDKLIYVDSDGLILRNIDPLFELPVSSSEIYAASDCGWPDCFNSGFFMLKPNLGTFRKLKSFAKNVDSFDGSDQGLLNEFFHLTGPRGYSWKRLPFGYNCTLSSNYEYLPALLRFQNDIKVIHFIGKRKPWKSRLYCNDPSLLKLDIQGEHVNFYELWWSFYDRINIEDHAKLLEISGHLQPRTAITQETPVSLVEQRNQQKQVVKEVAADDSVNFPTFYYKESSYTQPLKDESSKGDAWKLSEPKFNFPTDERSNDQPQSDTQSRTSSSDNYASSYVKEHPIFPWEQRADEPSVSRVFYNSPTYELPSYTISLYDRNEVVPPPAASSSSSSLDSTTKVQSSKKNIKRNEKKKLIGFDDGEELEHYLTAVKQLPAFEDEQELILEKEIDEKPTDKDANESKTPDEVAIENDPDIKNEDKYTEEVATDPTLAKIEDDLEDDDRETKLENDCSEDAKMKSAIETNEEESDVDQVVNALAKKVSKKLDLN